MRKLARFTAYAAYGTGAALCFAFPFAMIAWAIVGGQP